MNLTDLLKNKSLWVKQETLKLHKRAPGTRIASSLSCIEILVVLYYGKILSCDPKNIQWDTRDRFIVSKAHGSVSLYPILADFGFFEKEELKKISKEGAILGDIPDNSIPGFETINGSLGHGLGVACGVALALKRKNLNAKVFVLSGDGELYEGSVWEAIMFASHHKLDNLTLIIDNNKICMLDYCKNILNLEPLDDKFRSFGWMTKIVDGHDIEQLYHALADLKKDESNQPKVLIADTIKGKGVPRLENDSLCHIKALKEDEIDKIIMELT
ncbi:MAG: transketolase [Planctomycetes bacterium]|nr:transketolase [Planctomycetota bacterium]